MLPNRTVLLTKELAERWGWNEVSIRRAVTRGTFPVQPIGNMRPWRFSIAAVEAVERGEQPAAS